MSWWLALAVAQAGSVFLAPREAEALRQAGPVAVIDARGRGPWKRGHVPGSWPLAWEDLRDGWGRTGRLTTDLDRLRAAFRTAGVRQEAPVLVVGAGAAGWGEEGRLAWTLEFLGHAEVHVVDGGMPAWEAAGLPVVLDRTPPPRGDFTPRPDPRRRVGTRELAAALAGPTPPVVWDVREREEYLGATPYGEARGGHIPGARSLPFSALFDGAGRLLPREALLRELARAGIPLDRPVVAVCTGGVRSGFAYVVLRELGHPAPANDDASMWDWAAQRDLPLVRGPEPGTYPSR